VVAVEPEVGLVPEVETESVVAVESVAEAGPVVGVAIEPGVVVVAAEVAAVVGG